MEFFVWIVQGLLAILFIAAGLMKVMQPKEKLAVKMEWVNDFSIGTLRFVGWVEILGAFGLILPSLLGLPRSLVALAALGLAVVQFLAMGVHHKRGERSNMMVNLLLFMMAIFVAYFRY